MLQSLIDYLLKLASTSLSNQSVEKCPTFFVDKVFLDIFEDVMNIKQVMTFKLPFIFEGF